jgi:hypothetical protein
MAFNFDVSILNPLRLFQLSDSNGASSQTINYATFDANYQTRPFDNDFFARNIPNYDRQTTYCQPYQQGDVLRIQFLGLQNDGTNNQYLLGVVNLEGQSVLTASPTQGVTPIGGQYITEFSVPLIGVAEGEYFVSIRYRKFSAGSYTYTYLISEPIDIKQSHENTLLFEYENSYNTQGIIFEELSAPFHFRVHSALTELNPDSKFTTYEDEPLNLEMLSGTPFRLWTLGIGGNGNPIPQWVADKIERITLCDTLKIDGKLYTRNEGAKLEANRKQRTPLFSWKIALREKINDNNLYISDYQANKIIVADVVEGLGMIYARDLVTTTTYQIRQFFNGYTGLLQYLNGAFKISSGLGGTFGIDIENRLVYTPSSTAEATQFATPTLKILPYTLEITTSANAVQVYVEAVLSGTTTYAVNYNDNSAIIYGTTTTIYNPTYTYSNTKQKTIFIAVDDAFNVSNIANIIHSYSGYFPPSIVNNIAFGTLTEVGNIFKFCGASLVNVSFANSNLPQTAIDSVLKSIYLNEKIVNATINLQQTPATPCSDDVAKNIVPYIIGRGNIVYLDNQFVPASPVNIGLPVISGTAQPANNLTCSNGTWTGYPTPNFQRKWQQSTNGGLTWNDFSPQQTGVTYAVQTGDVGSQIRCIVTGQNSQGVATATANPVTITSALVGSAPYPLTAPSIAGTTLVGSTLTLTAGTWGGTTPITLAYQWLRDGQVISGATGTTYVTVSADAGMFIQVRETATNTQSNSNVSNAITPTFAPANVSVPTISGTTATGSVLTANVGTWSGFPAPSTFTYNWQRSTNGGVSYSNLGVTTQTYTVVSGDEGNILRVQVTGANGVSPNATANSAGTSIPTSAIQRPENTVAPAITGTPAVGNVLTCSTGTWNGSPSGYTRQWYRGTTPVGTNSATYTPVIGDVDALISCVVTATNAGGNEPATSNSVYAHDADFYAVVTYAVANSIALPSDRNLQLFSQLVTGLKASGFWTTMDCLWFMANDSASGQPFGRINWKNPATAYLTPVSSPTWSVNTGYTFSGANYIDTNFNPATMGVNYTLNNAGRYAFIPARTATNNGIVDGNAVAVNDNAMRISASSTLNTINSGTTPLAVAQSTNQAYWQSIVRTSSTAVTITKDLTLSTTATSSSVASSNQWIGRTGTTSPLYAINGQQIAFYAMGAGIANADILSYRNLIMETFYAL